MNDPKNDVVREKAQDLLRRLNYSSEPPKSDADSRKLPPSTEKKASPFFSALLELFKEAGTPPPLPAAAKLLSAVKKPNPMADALFSGMKAAPKTNVLSSLAKTGGVLQRAAKAVSSGAGEHATELAGLGILAVPGLDALQAHTRAALAGDYGKEGVKSRTVLPHVAHPLMETAGLGVLAAPSIAHLRGH